MTEYFSHCDKPLEVHTRKVIEKVQRRTSNKLAEIAARFHDLGKINPYFQAKLLRGCETASGKLLQLDSSSQAKLPKDKARGYSHHSYLSALAWLSFCTQNREWLREYKIDRFGCIAITTLIARHHGNLPDLGVNGSRIFNKDEAENLRDFLAELPDLPLSDFLQKLEPHKPFSVFLDKKTYERIFNLNLYEKKKKPRPDPLAFYLETQFAFACLIEADKRDAGYNETYNKQQHGEVLSKNFAVRLKEKLNEFKLDKAESKSYALNKLRTKMREQALESLQRELNENLLYDNGTEKRVFTLSAPTGAGKTYMLLQLAAEILKHDAQKENQTSLGIIYALPFLTITEQTEAICKSIFHNQEDAVMRVDSRARNNRIEELQEQLEANPDDEKLSELMSEIFSEDTFDHPFIVTTFVQVFETLISNRNATLLRLPNFARAIFLIDEIQALPPQLYTFFIAYLDEFCRKFDSYAIVSTATMPALKMKSTGSINENPISLFKRYKEPCELLNEKYFTADVFNRYCIKRLFDEVKDIDTLAKKVGKQSKSCLVVLNTVKETQELYKELIDNYADDSCTYVLLNTLFTPNDRQEKLNFCQSEFQRQRDDANYKRRVVLISTQLIEAGVDISFPVLYRDMCPLPNLIQSAGRCNRNREYGRGEVFLFELKREHGKSSSEMIYGRTLDWFLTFTKNEVKDGVTENEMFTVQRKFFDKIKDELTVGKHEPENGHSINMVNLINELAFEQLGKFRLIEEDAYREEFRYFIPRGTADHEAFDELEKLVQTLKQIYKTREFNQIKEHKSRAEVQLRKLSSQIVNVKVTTRDKESLPPYSDEVAGIRKLAERGCYLSSTGFRLKHEGGCFPCD